MIRMFVLAKERLDKIFEYGVVAYPHEACGLLLGRSKDGVWEVLRVLPASNTNERTLDRYREQGLMVFTRSYHLRRGYCCESGCRHCPYGFKEKSL